MTPHRWTPYFATVLERKVIETNTAKWDYKHQVLATAKVPPWRILMWVKSIEVIMQMRPKALLRVLLGKDRHIRHGMRWYTRMGKRVWLHEIVEILFSKDVPAACSEGAPIGGPDWMATRRVPACRT